MIESRLTHRDELWTQLVIAGAFDETLVDELKEAVSRSPWKPLGSILIELGLLRLKQVGHLLRLQADEMHLQIGALAIREGYCTPKQIDGALAMQFEQNLTPIEVIAKDERVDLERLMDGLTRYIISLEASARGAPIHAA